MSICLFRVGLFIGSLFVSSIVKAEDVRIDQNEAQLLLKQWVVTQRYYPVQPNCLQIRNMRLKNMGYAVALWASGCREMDKWLGDWRIDGNTGELYVMEEAGKYARPKQSGKWASVVLREQRVVMVDGGAEIWQLQWRQSPKPYCSTDSVDTWQTCPCHGYAFGQSGKLDLVRLRHGQAEERLPLGFLFSEGAGTEGESMLPRWPVMKGDRDVEDIGRIEKQVKNRPPVGVMNMGDYDHNGQATEFVLQIGAEPCGHTQAVAVGVSSKRNQLHAFGTVAHPDQPLVFERRSDWEKLRESNGQVALVQYPCGDHGGEQETEIRLQVDQQGLHATSVTYDCSNNFRRGKVISKTKF
ncbi:hypothetical protein [Chitinivorax sp. B]|uniref:hypothetical protein n=1 Tax=Chitinivorax sp. B TaxID=2502235 RepID=UPI0010F48584|nr:hypothetical protein [Chitinivorax sp. B]